MRWNALFADLEAQLSALDDSERAAEVAERARAEAGRLRLSDRLRAGVGTAVRVDVAGDLQLRGQLMSVSSDWFLLGGADQAESLVVTDAVQAVAGLSRLSAVPPRESVVAARLGLRSALRAVVLDRSGVRVTLRGGRSHEGTLERVGADFVELAIHASAEPRRRQDVRGVLVVTLAQIAAVRRGGA